MGWGAESGPSPAKSAQARRLWLRGYGLAREDAFGLAVYVDLEPLICCVLSVDAQLEIVVGDGVGSIVGGVSQGDGGESFADERAGEGEFFLGDDFA